MQNAHNPRGGTAGAQNRHVVITGASKGLGFAFAEAFAAGGYSLTLCARNAADLERAANVLQRPGITVRTRPADLSTAEGAKAFGTMRAAT
jgi:3-oxoacyl-[acyl-carrier protein] reductase